MRKLSTVTGSVLGVALMAMAGTAIANPGDHALTTYGGSGGQYFLDTVMTGFMVGFHGRAAQYNDQVQWIDQGDNYGSQHGGTGGNEYESTCPSGYVVDGIYGRAAQYVDQLGLYCVPVSTLSQYSEAPPEPAHGGNGGYAFASRCFNGEGAVGIQGHAWSLVDQIGLICNTSGR